MTKEYNQCLRDVTHHCLPFYLLTSTQYISRLRGNLSLKRSFELHHGGLPLLNYTQLTELYRRTNTQVFSDICAALRCCFPPPLNWLQNTFPVSGEMHPSCWLWLQFELWLPQLRLELLPPHQSLRAVRLT